MAHRSLGDWVVFPSQISVKGTVLGGSVAPVMRRVSLVHPTFPRLLDVLDAWSAGAQNRVLTYTDGDGDVITIGGALEWQECVRTFLLAQKAVKLEVLLGVSPTPCGALSVSVTIDDRWDALHLILQKELGAGFDAATQGADINETWVVAEGGSLFVSRAALKTLFKKHRVAIDALNGPAVIKRRRTLGSPKKAQQRVEKVEAPPQQETQVFTVKPKLPPPPAFLLTDLDYVEPEELQMDRMFPSMLTDQATETCSPQTCDASAGSDGKAVAQFLRIHPDYASTSTVDAGTSATTVTATVGTTCTTQMTATTSTGMAPITTTSTGTHSVSTTSTTSTSTTSVSTCDFGTGGGNVVRSTADATVCATASSCDAGTGGGNVLRSTADATVCATASSCDAGTGNGNVVCNTADSSSSTSSTTQSTGCGGGAILQVCEAGTYGNTQDTSATRTVVSKGISTATTDTVESHLDMTHCIENVRLNVQLCDAGVGGDDDDASSCSSSYEDNAFDGGEEVEVEAEVEEVKDAASAADSSESEKNNGVVSVDTASFSEYSDFGEAEEQVDEACAVEEVTQAEEVGAEEDDKVQVPSLATVYANQLAEIRRTGVSATDDEILSMLDEVCKREEKHKKRSPILWKNI